MLLPCSIYSFRNRALSSPPYHLMAPISGGKSVRSSSHHLFETKMGTLSTRAWKPTEDNAVNMPPTQVDILKSYKITSLAQTPEYFYGKCSPLSPLCVWVRTEEKKSPRKSKQFPLIKYLLFFTPPSSSGAEYPALNITTTHKGWKITLFSALFFFVARSR